mmetsp:Transcript_32361/g.64952  ORF Transcript_32361/g.64952 Transcript_32361/m.64952 type:complete len:113 (-) Transcript_32361:90-428(-)
MEIPFSMKPMKLLLWLLAIFPAREEDRSDEQTISFITGGPRAAQTPAPAGPFEKKSAKQKDTDEHSYDPALGFEAMPPCNQTGEGCRILLLPGPREQRQALLPTLADILVSE